jgi:hypothetical protein
MVYLGERTDFPKRVAVKVLHAVVSEGFAGTSSEQGLLSLLDHPNIVRLLEHGISEDGRRFLVMEYVEGLHLDAFADAQRLAVDARIALLIKVMEAVSHAHRHLVVHADLKPSNLLVDASGEPMLLDFGIGALVEESSAAVSAAWTPAFASPEQREEGVVTIASDVYALGVLGTLLLAGCLPATENDVSQRATGNLKRLDDGQLQAIALARSTSPAGLRRALSGDLDAILAKALQRLSSARYLSVELFADDLKAHLAGHPVAAQPWSRKYLFDRWVRRHRTAAVVAALLLVVTSVSVAGVTVQAVRAARERRAAVARLHEIVHLTGVLEGELYDSVHSLSHGEAASNSLLQVATLSGFPIVVFESGPAKGTVAVLDVADGLLATFNQDATKMLLDIKLSGTPVSIAKNEADGTILIGYANSTPATGTTTFAAVNALTGFAQGKSDPDPRTATSTQYPFGFLAANGRIYISQSGTPDDLPN